MKHILYFIVCLTISVSAQERIEASFIEDTILKAEHIVDIDNFGTYYYISNNTLYKNNGTQNINYSNVQLGKINSVDAFNPLKINLFYKDFNTAIILDNRLAEIFKIDFNIVEPYKNISHISTGNDNSIWLFNQDSQQLELYNYKTNKVRANTLPIQSAILDLKSNYNFCWLLTEDYLYKYNYFGSLIFKVKNEGYTKLNEANGNLVLKKGNELYYLIKGRPEIQKINLPNLLINQFLLTNETLYIYQDETLSKFQLKN